MDKAWMMMNRLSREYEEGVQQFLHFATQNVEDPKFILCPCAKCANLSRYSVNIVKAHLFRHGMDQTYHKWIWHGERYLSSESVQERDQVVGDVEDPIDMVHDAYDTYEDNPSQFRMLLEDAEKPLYAGCSTFTKLSAIVKLYNLKARYCWSDTSFSDLLSLLGEMLPEPNELPLSLYEAKKSMYILGMSYEKIHACPNDCILYRKEYEGLIECPTCGVSRWKVGRNSASLTGIPAKVLWYFPPIPRFRRMFRTKEISKELTWHIDNRSADGYLRHPSDAPAWKLIDNKWPEFGEESRNLRLALSADGINPYTHMNTTYSCWPIILVTYNLPPSLCMKRKFMMLTLLISGPKQPGNDIDVYLAPLIDDLKELWEVGVEAYDAYREENFTLKCVLLWTINDFPAYGCLSGCKVKGYVACPICGDETHARWLKHGKKMSYRGHRRFLNEYHPYRRQKKSFDGQHELKPAPRPLNGDEVLRKVSNHNCIWGKKKDARATKEKGDRSCWKKKSIFFELKYWKHLHIRHILDVMHIEKNVAESLIGTLLDIPGKTKDGISARLDLVDMGVRKELAPTMGEKKTFLPPACYTLSKEEKRNFCSSLYGMKMPLGYSSNIANLVSMDDLKLTGLKSHDYHILMQQLLPIAIRGVLPKHVRYAITRICLFFNEICKKVIDVPKLEEIQREIVHTLCLLEKYFLPSFFDIMIHLMVHLIREVKLCGPVWYRWMYPFERYMRILKGYVRNRNRPEGCIAECYVAEEAVDYCSNYLSNVHTIGMPSAYREKLRTKPLSCAIVQRIGDEDWLQAHRYVLINDKEIDPYIDEHKAFLKEKFPHKAKMQKWLQDEHNRSFVDWLREHANNCQVSERVKWLACGPSNRVLKYSSFMIDGVTFHSHERDESRAVQNSGVRLVANIMQVSSAKDKNPIVSDMVFYGTIKEIWELDYQLFRVVMFKCNWVENNNGLRVDDLGFTLVNLKKIGYKNDSFILGRQAKQVFYIKDPQDHAWSVVLDSPNRHYIEYMDDDELGDVAIQLSSLSNGFPTPNLNDDLDEREQPCVREDCDGVWIENLIS